MSKQLKIDPEKCSGCRSCELACGLKNEHEINPSRSRIDVISFLEGQYPLPYHLPSTCRQCADAPCLRACPTDAISRSEDRMETVVIEHELCIHCKKCVIACPFGVMLYDKEAKVPYKCELCDGDPACVSLCPTGAIVFIDQKPFASKAQALQMQAYSVLSKRNKSADVTSVHDGLEEVDDGLD